MSDNSHSPLAEVPPSVLDDLLDLMEICQDDSSLHGQANPIPENKALNHLESVNQSLPVDNNGIAFTVPVEFYIGGDGVQLSVSRDSANDIPHDRRAIVDRAVDMFNSAQQQQQQSVFLPNLPSTDADGYSTSIGFASTTPAAGYSSTVGPSRTVNTRQPKTFENFREDGLSNLEELDQSNVYLGTKEHKKTLIEDIHQLGGDDPGKMTRNALKKYISAKLAGQLSWAGMKKKGIGKRCFKTTKLCEIIIRAVLKAKGSATDETKLGKIIAECIKSRGSKYNTSLAAADDAAQ